MKSADNFNSSVDPIIAHFEAEGNQFTGTIPSRFGTLPSLKSLDLHKNKLDSEIPKNICDGLNRSLKKLDLSSNMNLKGKIPDELRFLSDLTSINFNYNSLEGPIPSRLKKLHNLSKYFVQTCHPFASLLAVY